MYNLWLYNSIDNIQSMCDVMFESFSKSILGCNIEGIYQKQIFNWTEYGIGCTNEDIQILMAVKSMHADNTPLLPGKSPLSKY